MRPRRDIAVAAAACAAGIVAFAPAELVAAAVARAAPGFSAAGSAGTVWSGTLRGAAYNGAPLGEIAWRARPLDLIAGRIGARVSAAGGALDGAATMQFGLGRIDIVDGDIRFRLDAIRKYSLFGAPYRGSVTARITRLALSREGCAEGAGAVSTTALDAPLMRLRLAALPLSGPLSCTDGALVALLSGESADGRVEVEARATAARAYTLAVRAMPARRDLAEALELAGFERDGASLNFRASGQLKGLGS